MADSYKIDLTVSADLRENVCCSASRGCSEESPRNKMLTLFLLSFKL